MENEKRIITDSGQSRPLNKANWEEEFLSHLPGNPSNKAVSVQAWSKIGEIANDLLKKEGTNGQITREKLGALVKTNELTGVQAQINAALYDNFSNIKKLSNPTLGKDDTAPLSPKDIAKLCETAVTADAAMKRVDRLTFWADDQKNLQRFSTNSSGTLSYSDLTKLQSRNDVNATDRSMIGQLQSEFQSIAKNNTIGKPEIDAYFKNFRYHDSRYQLTNSFLRDLHDVSAQQQPGEHHLFKDAKQPIKDIAPGAIEQGHSPDCSFEAALIGLAANRPDELLGMMRENSQHEVTVQFPNSKDLYKIPAPSEQEVGLFGGDSDKGYWPTVMQNAYGQKTFASLDANSKREFENVLDGERAGIDRHPDDAIKTLTGHKAKNIEFYKLTTGDLQRVLQEAQSEHKIATFGINGSIGETSIDGFSKGHGYAFLGIDDQGLVTLRDPRGIKSLSIRRISVDMLKNNFNWVCLETDRSAQ